MCGILHRSNPVHPYPPPTGDDLCRELSPVAKEIVVAARSWKNPAWADDPSPFGQRLNITRRGMITALHADGGIEFARVGVASTSHVV